MERKIGDTFEFEGKKIKVTIASNGECNGCILDGKCTIMNKATLGKCVGKYREDGTSVKFVEAQEPKKERFDPKTLKPFDSVLVYGEYEGWFCTIFSHIGVGEYPYNTASGNYGRCIPYNDETKHLVGTKDEAPDFYRYWED